ncbi:MAG TPA: DCC1-like thiol-disulfide oxidoreductase family protein, partial [Chitinophagaceae bacterium]|nr:DCC1-like thiol-disulfide oxidoreductase family protein [Chitinophagaceae bacterium]
MNHPIVLFDGVCNYCNTMVNFAIKWNKKRNLRFAPLQSEVGIALLKKYSIPENVDSVIFIEDE